jgi:LysR family hydrogen peroxide-inducible transcriptional activator
MQFTLQQLRYVDVLARRLHFREAAEDLIVSQSALSEGLKELETALGIRLFERGPGGVRVTSAGDEVVSHARQVLAAAENLTSATAMLRRPFSSPLRLGIIPTIAPFVLPGAIPALRARWPEMPLVLREDTTAHLVRALGDGTLDAALVALEADVGDTEAMPLYCDPFLAALPRRHRLAERRALDARTLRGERVLLLEEGHCLREHTMSLCRRLGARESFDVRATNLATLVLMTAGGLGVTVLPAMASPLITESVRAVPLRERAAFRTIGLVWRRGAARADELRAVGAVLRETAPAGTKELPSAPPPSGRLGTRRPRRSSIDGKGFG